MQFIKEIIWLLVGIGLTLTITSHNPMVRQVGQVLCVIALLWRLLIYLRETQPSTERLNARGEPKLSVVESFAIEQPVEQPSAASQPVIPHGRTPVQKLLDEEPQN